MTTTVGCLTAPMTAPLGTSCGSPTRRPTTMVDGCQDALKDGDDDDGGVLDGADDCDTGMLGWNANALTGHDADGCRDADEDSDGLADGPGECPTGVLG